MDWDLPPKNQIITLTTSKILTFIHSTILCERGFRKGFASLGDFSKADFGHLTEHEVVEPTKCPSLFTLSVSGQCLAVGHTATDKL